MDVNNGLKELKEAVDMLADCITKWKKAEVEAEKIIRTESTKVSGANQQTNEGTTKPTETTKANSTENELTKDRAPKGSKPNKRRRQTQKLLTTDNKRRYPAIRRKMQLLTKRRKTNRKTDKRSLDYKRF